MFSRLLNFIKIGNAVRKVRGETGEEGKQRAKNYLVQVLGESKGLPTKIGQFMTMDGEDMDLRDSLNDAIEPMDFDTVQALLDQAYGMPYTKVFKSLEKSAKTASLGQVHFGKLKDGRSVAVKVQYANIAKSVESELKIMGFLPKVGPVSKWGFNLDGYRDRFWEHFGSELDYEKEASNQIKYNELVKSVDNFIVPEVALEACRPGVLVQIREDGVSLDEAEKAERSERFAIGKALLQHYLLMIFRYGYIHSDPHPGNFGFRLKGNKGAEVVLYDYGSVLELTKNERMVLLRIILAIRDRENLNPASCLAALGFEPDKLKDLRSFLPAILRTLFDPFIFDYPYDVNDWKLSESIDSVAGDLKWWFRSSAPPKFIFLMRTIHGLITIINRLNTRQSWKYILDDACADLYPEVRSFNIPQLPEGQNDVSFSSLSQYLKVYVKKTNGGRVELTMPARVADDLDGTIDDAVKETIKRNSLDLAEMQLKVRKNGFKPQVIFKVHDSEREVRVWLE
jgi:predicted unusual protein kinase regulating ubiquinone biosynthesis (AarF/ABC1/UbiB family)